MEKLSINFENCYGIKKLFHEFDFSRESIYSIYAPNGIMKTSFAKTFQDTSRKTSSKDYLFPERETIRHITDEKGNELAGENIFVIEPYSETFDSDKKSLLLVNPDLKSQYESILGEIDSSKEALVNKLKQLSGIRSRGNAVEEAIISSFESDNFYEIIEQYHEAVNSGAEPCFHSVIYNEIFNDKVIAFLSIPSVINDINDYIDKYNELIDSSNYLKRGFNHYHASTVNKNLSSNGFFEAKHTVNLFDGREYRQISNSEELTEIIKEEKERVLGDKELQKRFDKIDAKLDGNNDLRKFRDYLLDNKYILPELNDLKKFKKDIWISYFIDQKDLCNDLFSKYHDGKEEIEKIVSQAKREKTHWEKIVDIFNTRFSVPFELKVSNQEDVILKSDAPSLNFIFNDSDVKKKAEKKDLLQILSQGEKRALYILNIIFEVEARKQTSQETLFIIDDIADSFDYKNKYAIIEYLKDILNENKFYQIILTHNFDFYRTVRGRVGVNRKCCLCTISKNGYIELKEEKYQNNPFQFWKENIHSDEKMLIASIPFVRNLAEYCGHKDDFLKLTSLLHIKNDTQSITVQDLETIYRRILADKSSIVLNNPQKKLIEIIFSEADGISRLSDNIIELEHKIVLSIAIRLKAEKYMISKINDDTFVSGITKNQTFRLINKFKELSLGDDNINNLMGQVNLMTSENIHLNSFMYEPILDMSNNHLKQLYTNLSKL
jgi:hypothetical protein